MKNYFNFRGPMVLHILIYYDRSDRLWSAHCLDFNLVEDGHHPAEAERHLFATIKSYLGETKRRKMSSDEVFSPAPQFFWDLIIGSIPLKVRTEPEKLPIPYLTFKSSPINAPDSV